MNVSFEELDRIKSTYHLLSSDLCNADPCNLCNGWKIGIRGVTTPSDSFGAYGYANIHTLRYCIPCTDRKTYPNLLLGETFQEHTHKWEARNGKYGGFALCIKCNKTISAGRDEQLFRSICAYKSGTLERAISLAKESCIIHPRRPPPPILWPDPPLTRTQSTHHGLVNDSGYNDVSHDWDNPGPCGGDACSDPNFWGGDDGAW